MTQPSPRGNRPLIEAWSPMPGVGWGSQAALATISLVVGCLALALPVFSMQVFDRVLTSGRLETLWALMIAALVALAGQLSLDYCRRRIAAQIADDLVSDHGDNDAEQDRHLSAVHRFLCGQGPIHLLDLLFVPIVIVALAVLHWIPATATVAAMALLVATSMVRRDHGDASANGPRDTIVEDPLSKTLGEDAACRAKRDRARQDAVTEAEHVHRVSSAIAVFGIGLRGLLHLVLVAAGVGLALDGMLTLGGAIAVSILGMRTVATTDAAVRAWPSWKAARHAVREINRNCPRPARLPVDHVPSDQTGAGVRVVGAIAQQPARRLAILRGVSLNVDPGERVAVTGVAGGGKSTLAGLLVGHLSPVVGSVEINGLTPEQAGRAGMIGFVPQHVALPSGSVEEILSGFDPANVSLVRDRIEELGLASVVAQVSGNAAAKNADMGFSFVEKRLLMLGRATCRARSLVVLDQIDMGFAAEQIACLDRVIERLLAQNCAVVQVTARSSELRKADRVLVVSNGMITELDRGQRSRLAAAA